MRAQHIIDAKDANWQSEVTRCTSTFWESPCVDGHEWKKANREGTLDRHRLLLAIDEGSIVCELWFSISSVDTFSENGNVIKYSGWNLVLHRRNDAPDKENTGVLLVWVGCDEKGNTVYKKIEPPKNADFHKEFLRFDIGWVTGEEASRKAVTIIHELGRKFSSI